MTFRLAQDDAGKPVLWTARLRLRVPHDGDLERAARFWASERSHMMGGPWTHAQTRENYRFILEQWTRNGFGPFTVTRHGSDLGIGGIGPYWAAGHAEPELGWSLWDAADEGRGLALEAASAARDWFFSASGRRTVLSHTDPANTASHRLCERMGATVDPEASYRYADEPTLSWRHHARRAA